MTAAHPRRGGLLWVGGGRWGGVSRTPSRTPRHRSRTSGHPRPGRRRGGLVPSRSPDLQARPPRTRAPHTRLRLRRRPCPRTGWYRPRSGVRGRSSRRRTGRDQTIGWCWSCRKGTPSVPVVKGESETIVRGQAPGRLGSTANLAHAPGQAPGHSSQNALKQSTFANSSCYQVLPKCSGPGVNPHSEDFLRKDFSPFFPIVWSTPFHKPGDERIVPV